MGSLPAAVSCPLSPFSLVHSAEPVVQENGDEAGEGREAKDSDPGSPRRCDIIIISGRKEKCEAAKEALEVCVCVPSCTPAKAQSAGTWGEAWPGWDGRLPSGSGSGATHLAPTMCTRAVWLCSSAGHRVWGGHFPSPGLRVLQPLSGTAGDPASQARGGCGGCGRVSVAGV